MLTLAQRIRVTVAVLAPILLASGCTYRVTRTAQFSQEAPGWSEGTAGGDWSEAGVTVRLESPGDISDPSRLRGPWFIVANDSEDPVDVSVEPSPRRVAQGSLLGYYVRSRPGESLPADTEQRPLTVGQTLRIPPKKGWIVSLEAGQVLPRTPPQVGDVVTFTVRVRAQGQERERTAEFVLTGYKAEGGWHTK